MFSGKDIREFGFEANNSGVGLFKNDSTFEKKIPNPDIIDN